MILHRKLLVVGITLVVTVGCSGKRTRPDSDQKWDAKTTLILMNYEFSSDHAVGNETGCRARIRHIESGEVIEMDLQPGSNTVLMKAPKVGKFVRSSIYCGMSRVWKIPQSRDATTFTVYPEKVNYLGMFSLKFTKEATELNVGYHYDRDYVTFAKTVEGLPSRHRARLVSAYTGSPITEKVISTPKAEFFPNIRVKATKDVVEKIQDSPDLTGCVQEEKKVNPIFFGKLTYVAKYKKNKLSKLLRSANHHLYSPSFVRCVKRGIATFRPGLPDEAEFTIEF